MRLEFLLVSQSARTTSETVLEPTVRNALRSPRMLRTEILAGLVVALALIPEAIERRVALVRQLDMADEFIALIDAQAD